MRDDELSDGTPIVFMACACYVWPMALWGRGRCGKCGELADRPVARPADGKAGPLTEGA